jgi:hypothetical protein
MENVKYYTCIGSVRGACGVRHRTEEAAWKHANKDDRDAKRAGDPSAYSDRWVEAIKGDDND